MGVLDIARLIIYRMHEQGLEIFLINNEMENDPDIWSIPKTSNVGIIDQLDNASFETIDLTSEKTGPKTLAVEGDWHDIPSIRGMLKHDIRLAKKIIHERMPELEKGGFFAMKECFKKLLPHEYEALNELKDIITDRNSVKNI